MLILSTIWLLTGCTVDESIRDTSDPSLPESATQSGLAKDAETQKSISKLLDTTYNDTKGKTVQKTFNIAYNEIELFTCSMDVQSQSKIGVIQNDKIVSLRIRYDEYRKAYEDIHIGQLVSDDMDYEPTVTLTQKDKEYAITIVQPPYITYTHSPIEGNVIEKSNEQQ